MLIGEYKHVLDDKKRLSLPSKFRKELGETVVVTRGLDRCLFVYTQEEWKKIIAKLQDMSFGQSDSRAFSRFLLGGAVEVTLDKSGRVLIPDYLKTFAGLSDKVVLAGVGNRVELWAESAWSEYTQTIESEVDTLAERLGELGMV